MLTCERWQNYNENTVKGCSTISRIYLFQHYQQQQQQQQHWYEHVTKLVQTSHEGWVTILWIQQVHTDRTIPNNKPVIIVSDNEKRTCRLIVTI
jgi:hypothetical protein